ncbi:hypothetical protein ACLOJK_004425 [Asimina triloba]
MLKLTSKRDSWGIPDRWEEIFPEPVSAPVVGLAALQRLALMCLWGITLHLFPSRQDFLRLCEASAHLVMVAPVPSLSKVGRKQRKNERLRKRARSLTERESVRERRTGLQAIIAQRMAPATVSEALVQPAHEGMIGPTSASPLEGFSIVVEGSSFVDSNPSSKGFSGLPPLEGSPQVIDLEEERDASLLREQVVLLKSREANLLSEC